MAEHKLKVLQCHLDVLILQRAITGLFADQTMGPVQGGLRGLCGPVGPGLRPGLCGGLCWQLKNSCGGLLFYLQFKIFFDVIQDKYS